MNKVRVLTQLLVAGAALALLAGPAAAKKCEGVTMPDKVKVAGVDLVLNGMGIREATILNVDVYVAGLYMTSKTKSSKAAIAMEGPKRLVLHFVRDVDKDDVMDAYAESFSKQRAARTMKAKISKFLSMMGPAKDGQEWVFTYDPAKGLEVKIGGKVKGVVAGADFFKVFLTIWLGPNPPNKGLKVGLLGGRCG